MSVGGQMQSQNQHYNNQHDDSTNVDTTGNTTGKSSNTMTVNPTALFGQTNNTLAGLLGPTGLTSGQQSGQSVIADRLKNAYPERAMLGVNDDISSLLSGGPPAVNAASVMGPGGVSAPTAASLMGPYGGQYAGAVLDPSLAAFDEGVARNDNAVRTARDAGSAFGDRAAVADNVRATGNATARGALAGQLTGQGLQWAGQMGAGDAGNSLSANTTTAGNTLTKGLADASNTLAASSANASNTLADKGLNLSGQNARAGNIQTATNMGTNDVQMLNQFGQGGVNNLFSLLSGQTPAFGASSSGDTSGTTASSILSHAFGTSSGFGGGSGSSKGASIPLLG